MACPRAGSFLGLEHSQQPSPSPLAAQQQQQQQAPAAERPQLGATHLLHVEPAARPQRSVAAAEPRSLPEEEEEAPVSPQLSPEFSGFTVYTNKLHDSVDMEAPTAACSPEPRPARRAAGASADLRQSHVPWRDISSAVEASLSVDAGSSRGGTSSAAAEGRRSVELRHSEARSQQQQEGPPRAAAQQQPVEETERQRFQRMARLVLPTLDASQLDSLVRIGASLPSPDMLMSPEVLHHLLPRIWDSSANPLESATGVDVMQLLQQVQAAQPLPPAAAAAPQQWEQVEAGRAALASRQPMACGSGQEVRQQQQPQGGPRAARAGTWLSPLKVGQRRFEEGEPTPSPQSHVKAVFGNTDDLQFYLPFSGGAARVQQAAAGSLGGGVARVTCSSCRGIVLAGMQCGDGLAWSAREGEAVSESPTCTDIAGSALAAGLAMEPAAAKEEYRTRAKQAATVAPTAPVMLGGSPGRHQHAQLAEREGRSAAPAPGSRHSRQPSGAQQQLQRGSREGGMQVQQAGSLQSHQSSADGRESSAGTASRPGSRAASVAGSVGSRETLTAQPAGRKQAFLSRFQPMGSHVGLQPPAGEPGPGPQHHSLDSTSAVAPPAAGGRPAAYHKASVDENAAEGPAGLRRQPSGEAWARYSKAPALGSRSAPASPARGAAGLPAAPKQPGGTHALADSTNAAEGYLQRLAQQRAQHVYAPSRLY